MRLFITIACLCLSTLSLLSQSAPVSQVEGYLEVYPPDDTTSIYVGRNAGQKVVSTSIRFNAFFGSEAGRNNTTGRSNAFFGQSAGFSNTTGALMLSLVKAQVLTILLVLTMLSLAPQVLTILLVLTMLSLVEAQVTVILLDLAT